MTDTKYNHAEMGVPQVVAMPVQVNEPFEEPWTCQYVLTLLVNIFCFSLPCATIGTIHLMAARADEVRGYRILAADKKKRATAWTVSAFVIGLVGLLIYIIVFIVVVMQQKLNAASTRKAL